MNFAEDDTSSESFYLQSLLIALSVMKHRGEYGSYDEVVKQLGALPALLIEVKRAFEPQAAKLAATIKDSPYHIISGAGSTWPEAFYYGMCILEEMQWIRTRPVHASDFFHGTLELVEKGISVILFKGEDSARPLVERVEAFAPGYTDKLAVLDTQEMKLPGHLGPGPRPPVPRPAGLRAGARQRPSRGSAQPPADDPALLQEGGVLGVSVRMGVFARATPPLLPSSRRKPGSRGVRQSVDHVAPGFRLSPE